MLDWNNAAEFQDEIGAGVTVTLHYGHVAFSAVPDPDGHHVEVQIDHVTVYSDDDYKAPDLHAVKKRAEKIYKEQAAAWCSADMLAELLNRGTHDRRWSAERGYRHAGGYGHSSQDEIHTLGE